MLDADEQDSREAGPPQSIAQAATSRRGGSSPKGRSYGATIPSISAYSLLFACRSAAIVHISHREILKAYTDGGLQGPQV